MTYKDIYKLPFNVPESTGGIYAFSSNGIKVFTAFSDESKMHMKNIVNILNGEHYACKYIKDEVTVSGAKLTVKGNPILIRGWGKITGKGVGGLGIDAKEAAKLQDEFIKWLVDEITE